MDTEDLSNSIPIPDFDYAPVLLPEPDGEQILVAVVTDVANFADSDRPVVCRCAPSFVQGMVHNGVPYRPVMWFGPLTSAQTKALSRATMRLERDGFVVRVTEPLRNRVSHVRPTLAGLRYVIDVHQAHPECIAAGLQQTKWGAPLADALLGTTSRADRLNGGLPCDPSNISRCQPAIDCN